LSSEVDELEDLGAVPAEAVEPPTPDGGDDLSDLGAVDASAVEGGTSERPNLNSNAPWSPDKVKEFFTPSKSRIAPNFLDPRDRTKSKNYLLGLLSSLGPIGAWGDEVAGLVGGAGELLSGGDFSEGYDRERDAVRRGVDSALLSTDGGFEQGERAGFGLNLLGGVAATKIPGTAGKVAQGLSNPGGIITKNPIGSATISGTAGAGMQAAGMSREESPEGVALDTLEGVLVGAPTGFILGSAGAGGQMASKVSKPYLKDKLVSGYNKVLGVDKDAVNRYIDRPEQIANVSREELYSEIEDYLNRRKAEYTGAKQDKAAAVEQLRAENRQAQVPEIAINELDKSQRKLRTMNSNDSTMAYSKLIEADVVIPLAPVKKSLTGYINEFRLSNGQFPSGELAPPYLGTLRAIRSDLDRLDKRIPPQDIKAILQILDNKMEDIYAAMKEGKRPLRPAERALISFRRDLNKQISDIPGYAPIMGELNQRTEFTNELYELVGDNPRAALERFARPDRFPEYNRAINKLGETTGTDFDSLLEEYRAAQAFNRDPSVRRQAIDSLPESQRYAIEAESYGKIKGATPTGIVDRGYNKNNLRERNLTTEIEKQGGPPLLTERLDDLGAKIGLDEKQFGNRRLREFMGVTPGGITRASIDVGRTIGGVPGISHINKVMLYMAPKFGKAMQVAAQGGTKSLSAYHYVMWKRDSEYREAYEQAEREAQKFSDENLEPSYDAQP